MGDGQSFHKMIEVARVSVAHHHELPLWNPYECGGIPLWDNPQALAAAPLIWPALVIGTTAAVYFWSVVHGALAFLSMWLFARHELKSSTTAAFVGASVWAFSGVVQQHASTGHLAFASLVLPARPPLAARRDLRAGGAGPTPRATIFEGGVYPLPHLALFMAAEALTRAWPARRLLGTVRAGAIAFVVAFTVGAIRFLPVIAQLRAHKRDLGAEGDFLAWETFLDMFLARHHEWRMASQQYVWGEYASYLGPLVLLVALLGLLSAGLESAWMYALLVFAVALMFGHFHGLAPWSILKGHVFPFREMRCPRASATRSPSFWRRSRRSPSTRARAFLRRVRSPGVLRAARTVCVCVALVGIGDMISVNLGVIDSRFGEAPATKPEPGARLFLGGHGIAPFIDQPRQNRVAWRAGTSGASTPARRFGPATSPRPAPWMTAPWSRWATARRTRSPSTST